MMVLAFRLLALPVQCAVHFIIGTLIHRERGKRMAKYTNERAAVTLSACEKGYSFAFVDIPRFDVA